MGWLYGLFGAAILAAYGAVHILHIRRTRRMEAYIENEGKPPAEENGDGPLLPPEVTRDMIQSGDGAPLFPTGEPAICGGKKPEEAHTA